RGIALEHLSAFHHRAGRGLGSAAEAISAVCVFRSAHGSDRLRAHAERRPRARARNHLSGKLTGGPGVNMAVLRTYETMSHSQVYSMGAIDLFADARTSKPPRPQAGPPASPVILPLLGEFHFFVTKRVTPPTAVYDPPHEFISWTNRSGFFLFSG